MRRPPLANLHFLQPLSLLVPHLGGDLGFDVQFEFSLLRTTKSLSQLKVP